MITQLDEERWDIDEIFAIRDIPGIISRLEKLRNDHEETFRQPTKYEMSLYMKTTSRIPAIKAWRERTGGTLQEGANMFPYRGPVHDKTDQPK